MLVNFFTAKAEKFYPKRWWFMATSISIFVLLGLILFFTNFAPFVIFAIFAPIALVSWGMLCMCVWFHPTYGKIQPTNKFFGRLPNKLQSFLQWYSAVFLIFFILSGLVAFPLFAVLNMY